MADMTTVEIAPELWDELRILSQDAGLTINQFLENLVADYRRKLVVEDMVNKVQASSDQVMADYVAETQLWDRAVLN
ncbi:hypothetical protein [Arcanobacterium bovis]|uniref:Toxin-antitoxin system protein n=1 Tax=Arcanobacterium bovis TaxID=2529275 RepID=A0A4Q9V278_9ACTO|nr:hypothetical protein [Arcanobacterium bovis]TBW23726.1 hypothetical protein EZJ44_00895 [Arcanobacterium bovis]